LTDGAISKSPSIGTRRVSDPNRIEHRLAAAIEAKPATMIRTAIDETTTVSIFVPNGETTNAPSDHRRGIRDRHRRDHDESGS
jgi:hypothetical protein